MAPTARRHWIARGAAIVITTATCVAAFGAAPAVAHGRSGDHGSSQPITVVAEQLNGPRQVSAGHRYLLVAESDTGQVTAVNPRTGAKRVVVSGVPQAQGAVEVDGKIYVATGEPAPDSNPGTPSTAGLMVARPGGTPRLFADLTKYELDNNPDGQRQFNDDGTPVEAISNPYFVVRDQRRHGFLLVADAGGNDILAVDRRGRVSTFFVLPTVRDGACAQVPENDPGTFGCDGVPTGIAFGRDGLIYISALTSEVPGEGRVWVVNRKGQVKRVITGFSGPTGVAVDRRGNVYVSELLEGAPEGEGPPPEGFDPSTVGQIVRVGCGGERTYAQVTMPSGLLYADGQLWSSAWAIAGFVGLPDAGQVVTVSPKAFVPGE